MGRINKIKLIVRSILFLTGFIMYFKEEGLIKIVLNYNIFLNVRIYHIIWLLLMIEMVIIIIPKFNNYSYSGKLFKKYYDEDENYNKEKLKEYTKKNLKNAIKALISWILLNSIVIFLYYKLNLNEEFLYMIFLFYYVSDTICINFFCPFKKFIIKCRCCNECRIYNWGNIFYSTPFLFINSVYSYSLFLISLIIFIQWEYLNFKYPERFSPISNKNLRCSNCSTDCRYKRNIE